MTDQEWEEIRRQRQIDQERDAYRAEEARKAEKPAAPEREPVNPWWYVLAGYNVVIFFLSIFVHHYLFISTITRLCFCVMRIKGKITTLYFWPWYLISGIVLDLIQINVFLPLSASTTSYSFSFSLADVLLFWLLWQASSCAS